MKKLFGDWINLFSLCFAFSAEADGCNRSTGIILIRQKIRKQYKLQINHTHGIQITTYQTNLDIIGLTIGQSISLVIFMEDSDRSGSRVGQEAILKRRLFSRTKVLTCI